MENLNQNNEQFNEQLKEIIAQEKPKKSMALLVVLSIFLIIAIILILNFFFGDRIAFVIGRDNFLGKALYLVNANVFSKGEIYKDVLFEEVLPKNGIDLRIDISNLSKKMIDAGVIDVEKFKAIYKDRDKGLAQEAENILSSESVSTSSSIRDKVGKSLRMNAKNAGVILNWLWGFGLGNKSEVLEKGPMMDKKYGGAHRFASTGGWTLSKDNAMNHYSKYEFVVLNSDQKKLVEEVSKNIYRPCCGNSTYFPDCNHGIAMLGLLELLAAQNTSETEMYKIALAVNSYWFPNTYLTLAKYFELKGLNWSEVNPKEALGINFSSAMGYRRILKEVTPPEDLRGGSCGI